MKDAPLARVPTQLHVPRVECTVGKNSTQMVQRVGAGMDSNVLIILIGTASITGRKRIFVTPLGSLGTPAKTSHHATVECQLGVVVATNAPHHVAEDS